MVPGIAFSQGCRERISGVADITIIYIYIPLLLCIYSYHYLMQPYKLCLILSHAARPVEDASLR